MYSSMSFRLLLSTALLAASMAQAVNADAAGYERDGRKISLQIPQTSDNNVKAMRLTVVSDAIIRVEATPEQAIPQKRKSLVVVNREGKYKADVKEDERTLTVETAKLKQILYISRIEHPGKNHLNLLKAFELLPEDLRREYTLVMPGASWNGAETVFEYAEKSPCKEQFKFTGFVDFAKLPELYARSAMYIFPSHFEGFGLSLLEAMHAGLPCACSNNSSLGELGEGAAELFDPESPEEIAESMKKILFSPEYQKVLIQKGKEKAARFSWKNTADGFM